MSMKDNEVWIRAAELGFRGHGSDVFIVIKRYKRKPGYGIFEKIRGFNGFWKSRKLREVQDILEAVVFLTTYTQGVWRLSEDEIMKAMKEQGWFYEVDKLAGVEGW